MAKPKKERKESPTGTPVCTAMVLCDNAITGADSTLSIIRVIDTITFGTSELSFKIGDGVELGHVKLVVMIKRGDAAGSHELPLAVVGPPPSRKRDVVGTITPDFSGVDPESGYNLLTVLRLRWRGPGLYWLELRSGQRTIARSPFKIKLPDESEKD